MPFPLVELTAVLAAPPPPPVDKPKGFPFVGARLPAAPVMSLSELPYSRTRSPHERDVFAMLAELLLSVVDRKIKNTYDTPAPFPAPATPLPAAVTTAPAALPTPAAAADVVLDIAAPAPFVALVSHDCWDGGVGMCCCFLAAAGRFFFCVVTAAGMGFFFCAATVAGMGFLVVMVEVMGFFAVVEAMGALRTGVGVDFLETAPGMAFLVPMGWATILTGIGMVDILDESDIVVNYGT